jgi:predicted SAM-dependent methyltransferase
MELLIGCGSRRTKLIKPQGSDGEWHDLVTLDINADHKPDVVWDLNERPLPFDDETFTEIHAYEVLEHLGNGVGDYRSWFDEWSEWWRLLKPDGVFCGTCPSIESPWLFGDPSHRRVVSPATMTFLVQPQYTKQIGNTPMSDFRFCYRADFDPIMLSDDNRQTFAYVMKAVKPPRIDR